MTTIPEIKSPQYIAENTEGATLANYQPVTGKSISRDIPISDHVSIKSNKPTINFTAEFLRLQVIERCKTLKTQKLAAIETLKANIAKYTKSGNTFKLKVAESNLEDAYESLKIIEQQLK